MRSISITWLVLVTSFFFATLPIEAGRRTRDLGIQIGTMQPGPYNGITDVNGVRVGHVTLIQGEGPLIVGTGPVRTGVTAVLPHGDDLYSQMVFAACWVMNGNGEMTGAEWVNERGLLEVPIVLTNTLSVGDAYSGVVAWMLEKDPERGPLPLVAECWDGGLNDIAGRHVKIEHVARAIDSAKGGAVPEGSVGAGTGMRAYEFKAGIGTASRVLPDSLGGYTVGVLVNANCGRRPNLVVDGVPVGREIPVSETPEIRDGSIIVVIATDAPLIPIQLRRLCKRAALGVGRTGTISRTSSGDLVVAFSTATRIVRGKVSENVASDTIQTLRDGRLTDLFQATVESTEEAIINSLTASETMVGRDDRVVPGISRGQLVKVMQKYGRLK